MYTKFLREYDPSMPDEQASERIGWEHDSYPQAVDKPVDNYAGRAVAILSLQR
jgi:hypothetical protein